jgi:hypothetical protein
MTDAGASERVVWWPRLVLWGTVIAAGSLYLLSVEQHRKDAAPQAAKPPAALTAPAADAQGSAVPEPGSAALLQPAGGVAGAAALAPAAAVEAPSAHLGTAAGPVQATGRGPVAASMPLAELSTEPAGPEPGPVATVTNGGAAYSVAATVPETHAPVTAGSHAVAASDVTPVEARAFAEAVTEGPAAADQTPSAAGPAPAPGPEQRLAAPAARTQSPPDAERARILAEYEALRRAAERDLQPPGGRTHPWPRGYGPDRWSRGHYAPAPYGAPGPGWGSAPANPRW